MNKNIVCHVLYITKKNTLAYMYMQSVSQILKQNDQAQIKDYKW